MVRLPDGTERSTLVDRLAMIDSTKSGDILKALAAPAPAPPSRALDPKSKEHPKGVAAAPAQRAAPLDEARWPRITAAGRSPSRWPLPVVPLRQSAGSHRGLQHGVYYVEARCALKSQGIEWRQARPWQRVRGPHRR